VIVLEFAHASLGWDTSGSCIVLLERRDLAKPSAEAKRRGAPGFRFPASGTRLTVGSHQPRVLQRLEVRQVAQRLATPLKNIAEPVRAYALQVGVPQAVDIKQVGRELGVRYVLEGSIRKAGTMLRITGQLIDALTGAHLWADRFDGSMDDVFDLQDKVAVSVAGVIEPTLREAEIRRSAARPTVDLSAYDLYLRSLDRGQPSGVLSVCRPRRRQRLGGP
jgi:hypothetical protein